MKIGAFITKTRPEERGDLFDQCYKMATDCFDTVSVIDGKFTWPKEFTWTVIADHFQKGYEACEADWVIHLDTDFIFHEQDFDNIRNALDKHRNAPALSFWKYQFILPDRYNLKSRLVLAVNKAKFGDRIKFDGGGESDLCQPSLDGKYLSPDDVPEAKVAFYNYEKILKTKEQLMDDQGRMDRAWERHFGKYQLSEDGTDEKAYEAWVRMAVGRFNKPQQHIKLEEHPKYMQETIKGLKPENWGYNGHNNLVENQYVAGR